MGARSSCINSLHTAEATAAGMAKGELMAAREVFFTILKMVVPLAYARKYTSNPQLRVQFQADSDRLLVVAGLYGPVFPMFLLRFSIEMQKMPLFFVHFNMKRRENPAAMGQRLPFIFAGGLCALAQLMLFTIKGAGAPITER